MRVVLAEDLALLRDGLMLMLQTHGFEIVAAVESGPELLKALLEHRPDVAVVDVRLPPSFTDEGLQAVLAARKQLPGLPVLVLSQHVEQLYAGELLQDGDGGIGYLLKERVGDSEEFIEAVRRVAAGGTAMDAQVIAKLLARRGADEPFETLSPREREVLEMMAAGRSNAAIAQQLSFSEGTVGKHISNIFAKLNLPPSNDDNRRVLAVLTYLNRGR